MAPTIILTSQQIKEMIDKRFEELFAERIREAQKVIIQKIIEALK